MAWNCKWGHLHVLGQILEKKIFSVYFKRCSRFLPQPPPPLRHQQSQRLLQRCQLEEWSQQGTWRTLSLGVVENQTKKREAIVTWGELQKCQLEPLSPLSSAPAYESKFSFEMFIFHCWYFQTLYITGVKNVEGWKGNARNVLSADCRNCLPQTAHLRCLCVGLPQYTGLLVSLRSWTSAEW